MRNGISKAPTIDQGVFESLSITNADLIGVATGEKVDLKLVSMVPVGFDHELAESNYYYFLYHKDLVKRASYGQDFDALDKRLSLALDKYEKTPQYKGLDETLDSRIVNYIKTVEPVLSKVPEHWAKAVRSGFACLVFDNGVFRDITPFTDEDGSTTDTPVGLIFLHAFLQESVSGAVEGNLYFAKRSFMRLDQAFVVSQKISSVLHDRYYVLTGKYDTISTVNQIIYSQQHLCWYVRRLLSAKVKVNRLLAQVTFPVPQPVPAADPVHMPFQTKVDAPSVDASDSGVTASDVPTVTIKERDGRAAILEVVSTGSVSSLEDAQKRVTAQSKKELQKQKRESKKNAEEAAEVVSAKDKLESKGKGKSRSAKKSKASKAAPVPATPTDAPVQAGKEKAVEPPLSKALASSLSIGLTAPSSI